MTKDEEFKLFTEASQQRLHILSRREAPQMKVFLAAALERRYDMMLDIGANIGAYACVVARRCPEIIVHAFEAVPETHSELCRNVCKQGFGSRVIAHPVALSDQSGTVEFLDLGSLAGASAIASTSFLKHGNQIFVETRKLDDILSESGKIVLIKLDVEGHESQVLEGAKRFLSANECVLQVEFLTPRSAISGREILHDLEYDEALHIHNDYYFVPKGDERRDILRDVAFDAVSESMEDYFALADYAGKLNKQVNDFKKQHIEFSENFTQIQFPSGGWVS